MHDAILIIFAEKNTYAEWSEYNLNFTKIQFITEFT